MISKLIKIWKANKKKKENFSTHKSNKTDKVLRNKSIKKCEKPLWQKQPAFIKKH